MENLLRRVYNYAFATLRLASLGFYDEALGSLRGIAETANLLELFCIDQNSLQVWKQLPRQTRKVKFSPMNVRKNIISLNSKPVVDEQAYTMLCETGVHVTPKSAYFSHRPDGMLHVGGTFSLQGFLMVINELAIILGPCLLFASMLLKPEEPVRRELKDAGDALQMAASGELRATNYQDWLTQDAKFSRAAMLQLSEGLKQNSNEDEFDVIFTPEPNSNNTHIYPTLSYHRFTRTLKEVYPGDEAATVFTNVTDEVIHSVAADLDTIQGVLRYGAVRTYAEKDD